MGGGSGEVVSVIGGADGPTSIFVAGKTGDEEGTPAAQLDITQAKGEDFGGAAVLDYVSADKISFHCPLGYMVFQADESGKLAPVLGVTFEEAGGLVMEGDGRTAVLGGDTGAMVIPGAYQESGAETLYVFEEESGQIFESPMTEDMMEMIKEVEAQKPSVSEEVRGQLEEAVDEQTGSRSFPHSQAPEELFPPEIFLFYFSSFSCFLLAVILFFFSLFFFSLFFSSLFLLSLFFLPFFSFFFFSSFPFCSQFPKKIFQHGGAFLSTQSNFRFHLVVKSLFMKQIQN